jgi:membrane-associated protease RseP (regulator of RpoE activity)
VAVVVLLAGCQLRVGVELDVRTDGGGTLQATVGADEELLSRARQAGVSPLDRLAEAGRELQAEGWRVRRHDAAGGGREVTLSSEFADPEGLRRLSAELAEGLAAPELRPLEPFTLRLAPDSLTVAAAAGLEPTEVVTELDLQPAEAVDQLARRDAVAYDVMVSLPGEVVEANADRRRASAADGATTRLMWRIRPGESQRIRAVGTRPSSTPWPLVAGGATAAVVVAALAGWWVARRRASVGSG